MQPGSGRGRAASPRRRRRRQCERSSEQLERRWWWRRPWRPLRHRRALVRAPGGTTATHRSRSRLALPLPLGRAARCCPWTDWRGTNDVNAPRPTSRMDWRAITETSVLVIDAEAFEIGGSGESQAGHATGQARVCRGSSRGAVWMWLCAGGFAWECSARCSVIGEFHRRRCRRVRGPAAEGRARRRRIGRRSRSARVRPLRWLRPRLARRAASSRGGGRCVR